MKTIALALGLCTFLHGSLAAGETEFVVLVTGDGIRHQELFTGVDEALVRDDAKKSSGADSPARLRTEFWDNDPVARREKLMPFFWKELAREGVVLGNRQLGSVVNTANPHRFSYPGYAEILNGQAVKEVDSNDSEWSPRETLLEYFRHKRNLPPEKVAAFGSWKVFDWIVMSKENAIFCNAGYEAMPPEFNTARMKFWSGLQFDTLSPWDSVRHDSVTLGLALEYLRAEKPAFLYLALGETDDWAHNRRYDRTVQTLRYFDDALRKLWTYLQSTEPYRGRTTLIVTTDHGRGRTPEDWTSHGQGTPGSEEVWIGIFGPDTPDRGEARNTPAYSLSNIAATVLQFHGLKAEEFNPHCAEPISEAFK